MQELQRRQREEKILNDMLNDAEGAYKRSLEGRIAHVTDLQYGKHLNIFATSYSSIHKAAADGNESGIRYFLERDEKPKVYPDDYDKFGIAAIHYAAEKGYDVIINVLIEAGCPVDLPTTDGMTALMYAAKNNQLKTMDLLVLTHKASLLAINRAGMSAAHFAAQLDHVDTFEKLLQLNVAMKEIATQEIADAEMLAENPDAVAANADKAARKAQKDASDRKALDKIGSGGASGKGSGPADDASTASGESHEKRTKKKDKKADAKASEKKAGPGAGAKVGPIGGVDGTQDPDANPADELRKRYTELLNLPDTAIVDIPSRNGTRPIHIAATYNSLRVLALLIKTGAKLNAQDTAGENSLHKAARRCNTDAYKMLVAAGGYEDVRNTSRETAKELLKDNSLI
jgi:ankyrin repeat protein